MLITANNIFPRGASSVHLSGVSRSSVTSNRLHSFYPGMLRLGDDSAENLVGSNHFLRDHEPWTPFLGVGNGLDDSYGLLAVSGSGNSAFAAQVDALLTTDAVHDLTVTAVQVDPASTRNIVLDSGAEDEIVAERTVNAVRPTPTVGM